MCYWFTEQIYYPKQKISSTVIYEKRGYYPIFPWYTWLIEKK